MAKILFTLIGSQSPGTKPLSTSLLSSILKKAGHEVMLFDTTFINMGYKLDTEISNDISQFKKVDYKVYGPSRDPGDAQTILNKIIEIYNPDIICSSTMSDMFEQTVRMLTNVKKRFNIPIINGGIHATLNPKDAIKPDCIDHVVSGEGENIIVPLIESIINGDTSFNKVIEVTELVDLEDLPFLDYDIYDERQFFRPFDGKLLRSGDIQSMRGCPKRCTYCANSKLNEKYSKMNGWKGWRAYSPERFTEEAKYLAHKYNLEFFKFFDEDMLLRKEDDFQKLSKIYATKVGIPFTMQTHPNSVTKEKAKLLKDMGCASVTISMESGNEQYRKTVLKRSYSNDKFMAAVKSLRDANIRVTSLTMMGLPYESRKMIFETIKLTRRSKPSHANSNIFFPYKGTPLGDLAIKERFVTEAEINNAKFDSSRSLLSMPQINKEEIDGIRRMWSFYVAWPKFMYPLFKWLEKPTKIRKYIFNKLQIVEYIFKNIRKTNT